MKHIINVLKEKINKYLKPTSSVKKTNFFERELNLLVEKNMIEFRENYIFFVENCCPSCGCIIDKQITKTLKCPHCKEKIIIRTNKINNKKLLLNEKQLKQYDKFDKQRQEISFCEKYILTINNMYPKYMNKFYSIKSDKNLSVRDYTFSFENWLFVKLDNEAYYEYMKGLKLNFQDKILKCDQAIQKFKGANNVFRYMIELTKFEGKEEIALGMIFNLLYRSVNVAYLPYYHWKDRPFSQMKFYADINDSGIINENNLIYINGMQPIQNIFDEVINNIEEYRKKNEKRIRKLIK